MNNKQRGRRHTSLTETAALVVRELKKLPGIKMVAPGEIDPKRAGARFVTVVHTRAGCELLISGQGVQKVAVHTTRPTEEMVAKLKASKALRHFKFAERERRPGE